MTDSPFLTADEAARYLRVCQTTFREHVQRNVPVYRIGRKPMFKPEDLDAYMTESSHVPLAAKRRRQRIAAVMKADRKVAELARELEG